MRSITNAAGFLCFITVGTGCATTRTTERIKLPVALRGLACTDIDNQMKQRGWQDEDASGECEIMSKFEGNQYAYLDYSHPERLGKIGVLMNSSFDYLEDSGGLRTIPEHLIRYVDFDAYARDAELSGDIHTVEHGGQVHVFSTR